MAVNNSVMNAKISAITWLPNMQQPKLFTLCWRLFSEWGDDRGAVSFANKSSQFIDYA